MQIFLVAPIDVSGIAQTLAGYAVQGALWGVPIFAAIYAVGRMLEAFKVAVESKAHAYHWAREAKESGDAAFTGWEFDGNTDGGKEFEAGGYELEEIDDADYQDRYSAVSSAPESPESLERQWAMAGYDGEISALYAGSDVSGEEMDFEVLDAETDDDDDSLSPEEMAFAKENGWLDENGEMMDVSGDNTRYGVATEMEADAVQVLRDADGPQK